MVGGGGEPGSSALELLGEGPQGEQCMMWASGDFDDVGPGQTTLECNILSALPREEEAETIRGQKTEHDSDEAIRTVGGILIYLSARCQGKCILQHIRTWISCRAWCHFNM